MRAKGKSFSNGLIANHFICQDVHYQAKNTDSCLRKVVKSYFADRENGLSGSSENMQFLKNMSALFRCTHL